MPLDFRQAKERLENIRYNRSFGSSVNTPSGRAQLVMGPALHSETLEPLLVILDPETKTWTAVAPGAARAASAELSLPEDFDTLLNATTWSHKKGGVYTRVADIRSREGLMVLYVSHADGTWWLRPIEMYIDGRFAPSTETPLTRAELDM